MATREGEDERCMRRAIALALEGVRGGLGGPFGAVVVDERGRELGSGQNRVTSELDPTAHAEVLALRAACRARGSFRLDGCTLYASCEPCPMCLAAAAWARVARICYAGTRDDAAAAGFDDAELYAELARAPDARRLPLVPLLRDEALAAFRAWAEKPDKIRY